MILNIAYIIAGLILLLGGAEAMVRGAVSIANKFHVPQFIIGLTIIAIGTSAPEILVSVQSALDNYPDIALGNVIGSNIANIILVCGVSALIFPIAIKHEKGLNLNAALLLALSITTYLFILNGRVSWLEACVFLTLFAIFTGYLILNKHDSGEDIEASYSTPVAILLTIGGIALLSFGSDILVKGAVEVAALAGISREVIGLTIVSFGSSSPELAASVVASLKRQNALVIGNIIGSNIMNIALALGISGLILPLAPSAKMASLDIYFFLVPAILLGLLAFTKATINKAFGLVFIGTYIVYLYLQF